jgi:hypothetical protein
MRRISLRRQCRNGASRTAVIIGSAIALSLAATATRQASGQELFFGTQRPFVIGIRPVVGNSGGVGGVSIDAQGVVSRTERDELGRLRAAREKALQPLDANVGRTSELRKVSLRRLEAAIAQLRQKNLPVTDEIHHLAGLQRIRYVFVDPDQKDIILCGFAEGWKIGEQGTVVGRSTEMPVLQLDDLVVALRTAEAAGDAPISCSIDPTAEGVQRFARLLKTSGIKMSRQTMERLEKALGPQQVTIKGVSADSRFARVMVSADFLLKRLALDFEKPPIDGLPSYLDIIKEGTEEAPREAMPRWWLAPRYEPMLRDAEGLAWELRGQGVCVLTEDTLFAADGQASRAGRAHPAAKQWADTFFKKYSALSAALPAFAELRNCMDLAVVAALLVKEDLPTRAGFKMPLLMNAKDVHVAGWHVPKTLPSRGSFVKKGRDWIISVSGGVEINSWAAADKVEERRELALVRKKAAPDEAKHWWWD